MLLYLVAALRAIVEMLAYCLIGQAFLFLLAGSRRATNPIYQLLSIITRPPRTLVSKLLPARTPAWLTALICFLFLVVLWLLLSWLRKIH